MVEKKFLFAVIATMVLLVIVLLFLSNIQSGQKSLLESLIIGLKKAIGDVFGGFSKP